MTHAVLSSGIVNRRRRAVLALLITFCVGTIASAFADTPESSPQFPDTTINVTPSDNLTDDQAVTVVGTGFDADVTGQFYQCAEGFCSPEIGEFTTDSFGSFTTTVTVSTTFVNQLGDTVDCRVTACVLFANERVVAEHHLTFVAPGGPPTSKDQCKNGGWRNFGFRNQGECMSFVASGGRSGGAAYRLLPNQ